MSISSNELSITIKLCPANFLTASMSLFSILKIIILTKLGHSWLRHCATNRKVAGSITDAVTKIFHFHNPSGRTMALGPE
jgi:hypothetical protein